MYDYKYYENFYELKEDHKELGKRLLNEVEEGEWMNEGLYVYPSVKDFAEYEVKDGWYSDQINGNFNGAPNLYDYIDYENLRIDLTSTWDDSVYYHDEETDYVVNSIYGF